MRRLAVFLSFFSLALVGCSDAAPSGDGADASTRSGRPTGSSGGREIPPAQTGDVGTPSASDAGGTDDGARTDVTVVLPDAGTQPDGTTDDGGASVGEGGPLELEPIEVPETSISMAGEIADGAWTFQPPDATCAPGSGAMTRAVGYTLTNASTEDAEVRVSLRTARNGSDLTLADGAVYTYGQGVLPGGAATCTRVGVSGSVFSSDITSIDMAAGTSIEVLVAAAGAEMGTFQLTVQRNTSGGSVGDDVEPDPDPDPDTGGILCTDTCEYAYDFECDDGGTFSLTSACPLGTDCFDCGIRTGSGGGSGGCTNTCFFAADGDCDDGRPGSWTSLCDPGTDCLDCGPL